DALPEPADDGFLVDREVQREADLARIVQTLLVAGIARPRTGRTVILAVGGGLSLQHHPVARGIRRVVDAHRRLARLVQVIAEDRADVDLARPQAGESRRRIRDPADDELLERGGLPPVARHGLEPMVVALLALDVPERTGPDRMERRLVLSD